MKAMHYLPASRLADRTDAPHRDEGHGRSHCRGELGRQQCAQRSACALHLRQLKEPIPGAMRLPRVGANPCHYRKEIVR